MANIQELLKNLKNLKKSIYVKKKKGGGALLNFSRHLHLAMYFWKTRTKYSLLENTKNFKIDVEDACKLILRDKKNRNFLLI